ncbi:hypothetical protein G6F50_018242 [Rhizopus delemar]|uniref:Uncharacterized protein n=1 Tax=Rhizopus delemar TaxID=936053 RepID=A0A9P6XND5_9FUNG|nr:hypothetical protein G6F50_018242 [Rhizopus delemar]
MPAHHVPVGCERAELLAPRVDHGWAAGIDDEPHADLSPVCGRARRPGCARCAPAAYPQAARRKILSTFDGAVPARVECGPSRGELIPGPVGGGLEVARATS